MNTADHLEEVVSTQFNLNPGAVCSESTTDALASNRCQKLSFTHNFHKLRCHLQNVFTRPDVDEAFHLTHVVVVIVVMMLSHDAVLLYGTAA